MPIATDIAFALGMLALLGSAIPRGVRVLLLALAIIDDIIAVLVIAIFYSHDLRMDGAVIAGAAVVVVMLFQRFGIRSAMAYVLPGACCGSACGVWAYIPLWQASFSVCSRRRLPSPIVAASDRVCAQA